MKTITSPEQAQIDPNTFQRPCQQCQANLTLSHFGISKAGPQGHNIICKSCRSENNFNSWERKYGHRDPKRTTDIIRSVRHQNQKLIQRCYLLTIEIRGFHTMTKADYKVHFGRSNFNGMHSIALYDLAGTLYREFNYSGVDSDVPESILVLLKSMNIRLELNDLDVIGAKTEIYYL